MRAVNLLPEKHRPRRPTGGGKGSSYVLLGLLGVLLLALLGYVLTLNSINSKRDAIASAKAETARLQAQASQLGPFGDFEKVKSERVASVRLLTEGRFDWERLVRELAHVLPNDVWLTSASAADNSKDAADTPAQSSSGSSADSGPTDAPVMTLEGCARSQSDVAVTLVRLRDEVQDASDVQLSHSTRGDDTTGAGTGGSPDAGSCGTTHGSPNYSFEVNVTFATPAAEPYTAGAVPNSLGGGQ